MNSTLEKVIINYINTELDDNSIEIFISNKYRFIICFRMSKKYADDNMFDSIYETTGQILFSDEISKITCDIEYSLYDNCWHIYLYGHSIKIREFLKILQIDFKKIDLDFLIDMYCQNKYNNLFDGLNLEFA